MVLRQAKIDGGRVDRIDGGVKVLDGERRFGIEFARPLNQQQRQVSIDAPVPPGVSVGQGAARDRAAEPEVIELMRAWPKGVFDLPQAFAKSELSESQCQQMIPARPPRGFIISVIARDDPPKFPFRQKVDDLREDIASCMDRVMRTPEI